MIGRRLLVLICFVAALHGLFFIWYQRPDWYTQWSDQDGYRRLGAALATTGRFTRFPESAAYVPEAIRTPGYPAFVGAVYAVAGIHQLPVVIAQTPVFLLICLLLALMLLGPLMLPPKIPNLHSAYLAENNSNCCFV